MKVEGGGFFSEWKMGEKSQVPTVIFSPGVFCDIRVTAVMEL